MRFTKTWDGAIFGPVPFCKPRFQLSKCAPRMDPVNDRTYGAIGCNHPENEVTRFEVGRPRVCLNTTNILIFNHSIPPQQDHQFPALLRPRFPGFKLSPRRRSLSAMRDEVNGHSAPEEHRMRQTQEAELTQSAKKLKRVEVGDIQTKCTGITSDVSSTEVVSEALSSEVHYQEAPTITSLSSGSPSEIHFYSAPSSESASLEAPYLQRPFSEALPRPAFNEATQLETAAATEEVSIAGLPSQGVPSCQEPNRQTRDLEAAHILQALSSGAPLKQEPRKTSATVKVFTEGELSANSKTQPNAYGRCRNHVLSPIQDRRLTSSFSHMSGKWTPEEEEFSRTIVMFFRMGLIDLPVNTIPVSCAMWPPW